MGKITSLNNERVRRVQALRRGTRRRVREGLMVAEGVRLVREVLGADVSVAEIFFTEAFATGDEGQHLLNTAAQRNIVCWEVPAKVMDALAGTQTPQGILAVLPFPDLPVVHPLTFVLIVDGIRDPGNLGTILRSAWATGVDLVLVPPGNVDPFGDKVVRSGMGAHFYVPIRRTSWTEIQTLVQGTDVWLAEAGQGTAYDAVDWTGNVTLIVGGEARGAGSEARALVGERLVYIPMMSGVDSLNAAVATAVLLFEAAKQHRE